MIDHTWWFVRRNARLILVMAFLGAGAGFVASFSQPAIFASTATIKVDVDCFDTGDVVCDHGRPLYGEDCLRCQVARFRANVKDRVQSLIQ